MEDKKITIIGAGNGGQALSAYCSSKGYKVCLYNRSLEKLSDLSQSKRIYLHGCLSSENIIDELTDDIEIAVSYSDFLLIVTPATAHKQLARQMAPFLKDGHTIILNPGRTLGALSFENELRKYNSKKINVGETQTLLFACRLSDQNHVNIIGIKAHVPVIGTASSDMDSILRKMNSISSSFEKADSQLQVGLDNIGAIFHPAVVIFNAATIERNNEFYFYRDMTHQVASFIHKLDSERLAIGKAYGLEIMPVEDWIKFAYPETQGDNLCERMRNNPAYHDIKGPGSIFTRQLTEDIPTGILPMSELGKLAGVKTPVMDATIDIASHLLDIDFRSQGRNLKDLGLSNLDFTSVKSRLT